MPSAPPELQSSYLKTTLRLGEQALTEFLKSLQLHIPAPSNNGLSVARCSRNLSCAGYTAKSAVILLGKRRPDHESKG